MLEMKRSAMGKPAEEMLKIAKEKLQDVVVKPGIIWDTKETAWKVDQEARQANTEKVLLLENTYSKQTVEQAKAFLFNKGIAATPDAIKTVIDRASNAGVNNGK
jgi:hypothetical protein